VRCIAHLEHLAAAASAHTLQLGVPHTLHKHCLSIFTGPALADICLLLLELISITMLLLLLLLLYC
jgi:hypothetical protein